MRRKLNDNGYAIKRKCIQTHLITVISSLFMRGSYDCNIITVELLKSNYTLLSGFFSSLLNQIHAPTTQTMHPRPCLGGYVSHCGRIGW